MWIVAANSGELAAVLIPAVWAFLGIVVATLGTIAVQSIKSRHERRTATSPAPASTDSTILIQFAKEQGALVQRADDNDERDDVQDRRLDALERWAFDHDPDWRPRT